MKINISATSTTGCIFHIVGDVSLSIFGGFKGFSGTVSISGGGGCPDGTYNFGLVVEGGGHSGKDLDVMLSPNSISQVSSVVWKAEKNEFKKVATALNTPEINDAIVGEFRAIAKNINPCNPNNISVTVNVNLNKC